MVEYIDISVPTSGKTTVYPGDPSPEILWPFWHHEKGNPANVGFYNGGLHHGTHVDAPWHFIEGGKKLHEMPLDHWLGPVEVVDLLHLEKCIDREALEACQIQVGTERILFKTKNGQDEYWAKEWNPDFIYIDESAAQWCTSRGIITIGLDYLTVDPPSEPDFPAHMELLGNETLIIENICLKEVSAGTYELLAAPINLQDADGGWCRAILRKEN